MTVGAFRSRWAAVGAAVAVSLGAGGIGLISAAPLSSGERTVLVPTNCRLADTRPAPDNVGPKSSPLGPGETHTFSAHGTNGNCSIPTDATALSLNVTALDVTAPLTFLTLWNAGTTQPTTSSLNPAAGQPPTPNAVTVDLSATGQFKLFNALGTLNVIIDVTGYYQDHNHDDRYYTKPQVDAAVLAATELIPTAGKSLPTLADESGFAGITAETVTSTTTGQWLVSKTVRGYLVCPTASPFFFLLLDGVPLNSSAIVTQSGAYNSLTLIGATTAPIPAGAHTVAVGADCTNESRTGNGIFFATAATVTVLG